MRMHKFYTPPPLSPIRGRPGDLELCLEQV